MEFSTIILGLVITFELGYVVKVLFYGFTSRYILSRVPALGPARVYGICTFRDIDFALTHFNNARYLRAMDLGRTDFFLRARMVAVFEKDRPALLVAASTIRFRKPIWLFMPYRLITEIIYWDDKCLYLRQNFETLHDNFLRATSYVKLAVVGKKNPAELISSVMTEKLPEPELSDDLAEWMQHLKSNSDALKKLR